jgi:hypothetical protein
MFDSAAELSSRQPTRQREAYNHPRSPSMNQFYRTSQQHTIPPHKNSRRHTIGQTAEQPLSRLRTAQAEWAKLIHSTKERTTQRIMRPMQLTKENQRQNQEWGDIMQEKAGSVTRVYSLNLNGLSLDRRGGQFDTLCSVAKEVQADIICCQEHNVDTTQQTVRSILYNTLRQHWTRSRVQFGSTPVTFTNMYKPGGTMMFSVGHITGRVISQSHDHMGRWVTQTYRRQGGLQITIVTAYQVVTDNPHTGLTTATSQQRSQLVQSNDPIQEPRKAFKRDIRQLLKTLIQRGDQVMLLGDFNETIESPYSGIAAIAAELNMVDLMSTRSSVQPPATYARGRVRLDYGLATQQIAESLIAGGYEAFNTRYPTDHRAYYFDFDTNKLFGSETQPLASPSLRMLHASNMTQVTKYIREKHDQLQQCNAFERGYRLTSLTGGHHYAERLDKDVTAASLSAEKKTQQYHSPAWSIGLSRARKKVAIIKKCLSCFRNNWDMTNILQTAKEQGIMEEGQSLDWHQCSRQLRQARKEVKELIRISYQKREEELKQTIERLSSSLLKADKERATTIRQILRAEALKKLFKKFHDARVLEQRQGVTRIEIPLHPQDDPKNCTEWQVIDVPSEVVTHLQQRNRQHFGQAHGTPFTVNPLAENLGFTSERDCGDAILQGTYRIPEELSESTQMLLEHLQMSREMASLQGEAEITEEEFIGKLKVWRESTTTSPSGIHLGHYKALLARHQYSHIPDDDETEEDGIRKVQLRDELNGMQQAMLRLHVQLINYALSRGYSYDRWKTVVNTTLFKEPNNIRIHRTRVIHIYEADYNLMLGLKWRHALYKAEAAKQLNKGQFGSRPRRNAIDPVALEELQLEMSRLTRKSLVQLNFDAASCYDRIIPNLAMLASRRFGVNKQVTLTNAKTLEEAKYHIRTEMGLSESHYSHQDEMPIYGTGQGSGNSPMLWCFLSSLMYDCYDKKAHHAKYSNPDHTNSIHWTMVGFVDDSNGQVNNFHDLESMTTWRTLRHKAIANATTWAHLLHATGGALELTKCSYHMLTWKFSMQGAPVLVNDDQLLRELPVQDPLTERVQHLEYLTPYQAHKTLGHYKEPAGTQSTQFTKLKDRSTQITKFLWTTALSREETWLFYNACYLPAVQYPLTWTYFNKLLLDKIQRKAMSIITSRCGYNRCTKKELLYGPVQYGGAGFHHLYHRQGTQQVLYFLRHWRQRTPIGNMLKCVLSWAQFTVGVSYPILEVTQEPLPHLETRWLSSLRQFLSSINGGIQVDDPCIPQIQRQHDQHIMDLILSAKLFSNAEIRKLNYCRLFLQAVTLSDITRADGSTLDHSKLEGSPSLQSSATRWVEINQACPSPREWKLWRKANRIWSEADGNLKVSLGAWSVTSTNQRFQHFAYRSRSRIWVRRQDGDYDGYPTSTPHLRVTSKESIRKLQDLPRQAIPIDVEIDNQHLWRQSTHASPLYVPPGVPRPLWSHSFEEYVGTLDTWEVDLLQHIVLFVDPNLLCLEAQYNFRAASDGSVLPMESASFGWILSSSQGEHLASNMGPVRGRTVHSYRAEAYGVLSLLRFLIHIGRYTQMHDPWTGTLATDGQSMLDTLEGKENAKRRRAGEPVDLDYNKVVLDVLSAEWDVLNEIQHSLRILPKVKLEYVRGHQDRLESYDALPITARLNIEADRIASQYHQDHRGNRPISPLFPHTRAHLLIDVGTVTSRYEEAIHLAATTPPLMVYMCHKYSWTASTSEMIDWTAYSQSLQAFKKCRSHMVKFVHGILPTNDRLNKIDGGLRKCPSCQASSEDHVHILRCPHPQREIWRKSFLTAINEFCDTTNTFSPLKHLLSEVARSIITDTDPSGIMENIDQYPRELHGVIRQQSAIGWTQVLYGRLSKQWGNAYYTHSDVPTDADSKRDGSWQVGLIKIMWQKWRELWHDRNEALHGYDAASRKQAETLEVRRQLNSIYAQRHLLEPRVQSLLMQTVEHHDKQPINITKNWLQVNSTIFKDSARRVKLMALKGVRSIRTYFPPKVGPPH